MKRLLVSAAILPLLYASAHAETKISTATTTPVRTSTAALGQPDSITIETAGSVKPTASGAAVTADSAHPVVNNGEVGFTGVNDATGVLLVGGASGAITNAGSINVIEDFTPTDSDEDGDLDGPFAQGSARFGIRATGAAPYTGDVTNSGVITIEGNDSAGVSLETRLVGSLVSSGGVGVTGDRSVGIRADSVSGDVRITGAVSALGEGSTAVSLGDVDGALVLQNSIVATGYRNTTRQIDSVRARFDADDLKQGGPAVRITGSVGRGLLLDRPPADANADDTDEDDDGVADTAESTASLASFGAAPALDLGGQAATSFGTVGTGAFAFGIVNRGTISADGVNDGVSATAVRIGQAGGGSVTIQGGINNLGGTIAARAYGAQSTALLLNPNAVVTNFANTGTVGAEQSGGLHDARAIVDLSGRLVSVENFGVIGAVVTPASGVTPTGRAIAIDLSANTSGASVRQVKVGDVAPSIRGEVLFGSGADRLELTAGTLTGDMSFGAGADSLLVDGGATAAGRISDSDGQLAVEVSNGRLSLANTQSVTLSSLTVGPQGVLGVVVDPDAGSTRLNVTGQASLASGAQVDVSLAGLSRGNRSFQIIQAGSLSAGQTGVTLAGAPFLYTANLRAEGNGLFVDLRPKTASELGLNRSASQAFGAVFDSLDADSAIEQAFLAQTTQEGFEGLYEQMLPDHSGGTLMSAAAISSAISTAVSEPMRIDPQSAWGAWAQEIFFDIRRDRADAAGFKASGFGFAAGLDMQGANQALGLNMAFVNTDVRDRGAAAGEEIAMTVLQGGVYWRYDGGPLQATVRGGLGYAWFDSDRRLASTTLDLTAEADWGGWIADAHAQASYEMTAGSFYARPELSVSYLRLSEGSYRESGGGAGFDLAVEDRKGDLLTGQALLALGWRFGEETYLAPELKVGWRHKLAGDPGRTTASFEGGDPFTLDPEDAFDGGAVVRLGVRGGGSRVLFSVSGGGTFDGDYQEYDVRASARLQF